MIAGPSVGNDDIYIGRRRVDKANVRQFAMESWRADMGNRDAKYPRQLMPRMEDVSGRAVKTNMAFLNRHQDRVYVFAYRSDDERFAQIEETTLAL